MRGLRSQRVLIRVAVLALVIGATGLAAAAGVIPTSADELRRSVGGFGALGPPVFVAAAVGLSSLHLPPPLVSATAGLLFGTVLGIPLALTALTLAACTQMLIGRYIAGKHVRSAVRERARRLDRLLERRGLLTVFYVRLIPGVPFADLNYGAGATSLRPRDLALGTAAGSAPKTTAYVGLGDNFDNPAAPQTWIAIGLFVVFALVGAVLARRQVVDAPGMRGDHSSD
jgi:uncharacterized membrane protein YdjX (TVP38/TMEM64 family)